jgi:hypothetical protein
MDKTLEVLLKQVRDKRIQIVEAVSNNAAKDYSEYQKLCGEIRGSITGGGLYP